LLLFLSSLTCIDLKNALSCTLKCNCANPFYYFIIDTKNKISYQQAILKTPAKCILAPIPSVTVLQEIQTYVPPGLFWVGITRSAQNAVSIGNTLTQRANWNNLDGTAGPVATSGTTFTSIDSIWAGGEPNSGDTVAYFSNKNPYGLVGTTKVDNSVDGAIYKCCIDFCSDQSVSNQLGLSEIFSMN
jgi:hypothetical protein